MKKFITKVALFLLPVTLLAYKLDIVISNILKKNTLHAEWEYPVWNDLYNGKINADIVIYGSSRAWSQINPTMISDSLKASCYNLGIDGHHFPLSYFRHSLLLEYNKKPKLIIYSLDLFMLEKLDHAINEDQFLPYMLFNKQMQAVTIGFNYYKLADYNLPMLRYYGKKIAFTETTKVLAGITAQPVGRVKGFKSNSEPWNNYHYDARNVGLYTVHVDRSILNSFEKFIMECQSAGIKLILVYSPEYMTAQHFFTNRKKIINLYSEISKKYTLPFFDYSSDEMCLDKTYFYNTEHLNAQGTVLFTNKLIARLKNMN